MVIVVHRVASGYEIAYDHMPTFLPRSETQFQQKGSYFMKTFAAAMILVAGLALTGCGSNSSTPGNINGNWTASLTDSGSSLVYGFSTSLAVNGDGSLVVSNFQFASNSSSCREKPRVVPSSSAETSTVT
jgi:hypothetical protein